MPRMKVRVGSRNCRGRYPKLKSVLETKDRSGRKEGEKKAS